MGLFTRRKRPKKLWSELVHWANEGVRAEMQREFCTEGSQQWEYWHKRAAKAADKLYKTTLRVQRELEVEP